MDLHKLGVIINREYATRVKKKSFILLTFLVPVVFAAFCILPGLIMSSAKEESKNIAVVDESGIVLPFLESGENVSFHDRTGSGLESLKADMEKDGYDGIVHVTPLDTVAKTLGVESYSRKPLGMDLTDYVRSCVNKAVEEYRIRTSGVENLEEIMESVQTDIRLTTYTLDDSGRETLTSSEVYMIVSMLLGIIIYMFIAMFSGMVMSSVIEEKSSRVVEVLVSSVKATELMFGKIIGVALVALTQFFMWIVLTGLLVSVFGGIVGMDKISAGTGSADAVMSSLGGESSAVPGVDIGGITDSLAASAQAADSPASAILSTLAGLDYGEIIISFVIFFIFGYLLYASLFAAIGSAVENEADTQQLQIPVTIPLLIGFFIAIYAFKAPDSTLVFWGSMIPFTSPIVMLARIPFGVPSWQLVLSIVILIVTFVVCAWASAKIYKVGILMFGKKSSFKDLWKWLKQK